MKTSTALFSGVAAATLVGGLALAASASAQSSMNPPQYSTPQEEMETQRLNEQNLNGTTQTPAALNGAGSMQQMPEGYYGGAEHPPYGTEDENQQPYDQAPSGYAPMPNNYSVPQYGNGSSGAYGGTTGNGNDNISPGIDPQSRYQQELLQYEDQQQEYRNQRAQYEYDDNHYWNNLGWYDQARWNYVYPQPYSYDFSGLRLQRLYVLEEPSQLVDVPVEGPNGVWVGRIRNVDTDVDGHPARVEVALNRRVSVWVDPDDLRLDPDARVAFTNLTRDELWRSPDATVENGPL
ncbi:MAG TPA: hypothetical protein VN154_01445 [Rhizomicrobium sp.]|nr:hypothetical protein [Rhizomicrobium sp.]